MTGPTVETTRPSPAEERFDPATTGGGLTEAERFARYAWAAQFSRDKRVLDAACGVGDGTAMLAESGAAEAIGVDLDPKVIADAETEAPARTSFRVGDLRKLPFDDGEFDLVVCFEAIGQGAEAGLVLDELRRVLRAEGVLLLSASNSPSLTPDDLEAELQSRFRSASLRRQYSWIASAVVDHERSETDDNAVIEEAQTRKTTGGKRGRETCTIGIASDGDLPVGIGSVELTADIDIDDLSSRLDAADLALAAAPTAVGPTSNAELELMRDELTKLRRQLVKSESEIARLADLEARLAYAYGALQEYEALKARFDELCDRHEGLELAHRQVVHSSSWRLTAPLRRLGALLRSPS